jgi:putative transposase
MAASMAASAVLTTSREWIATDVWAFRVVNVQDVRIAVAESDRRWCSDGFEIACDNRERVRIAFALDCCDCEAMSWVATTGGITGDLVRDLMMEAVESPFGNTLPAQRIEWLTDNGSPYIARDTRTFADEIGLEPVTTAIHTPQSNGMAEAFVKAFKRDYVDRMDRRDAITVMRQLDRAFDLQRGASAQRIEDAVAADVSPPQHSTKR